MHLIYCNERYLDRNLIIRSNKCERMKGHENFSFRHLCQIIHKSNMYNFETYRSQFLWNLYRITDLFDEGLYCDSYIV